MKKIAKWKLVIGALWVILAAYVAVMAFNPGALGAAKWHDYWGSGITGILSIAIIASSLLALYHPRTEKLIERIGTTRFFLLFSMLWIFLLVLMFLLFTPSAFDFHYYTPKGDWRISNKWELNYPRKGGKYGPVIKPCSLKLRDNKEIVTFTPIEGKEIEILNAIGERGAEGFPDYVEERIDNTNFSTFNTSLLQNNLNDTCLVEVHIPDHRNIAGSFEYYPP